MFICIVVSEDDYQGMYSFNTKTEMIAFQEGIRIGSSLYGAGSCGAYSWEDLKSQENTKIRYLIKKCLKPPTLLMEDIHKLVEGIEKSQKPQISKPFQGGIIKKIQVPGVVKIEED